MSPKTRSAPRAIRSARASSTSRPRRKRLPSARASASTVAHEHDHRIVRCRDRFRAPFHSAALGDIGELRAFDQTARQIFGDSAAEHLFHHGSSAVRYSRIFESQKGGAISSSAGSTGRSANR